MHQRIIWILFFTAFILDIFRSQSGISSKKPLLKKTYQEKQDIPIKNKDNGYEKSDKKDGERN